MLLLFVPYVYMRCIITLLYLCLFNEKIMQFFGKKFVEEMGSGRGSGKGRGTRICTLRTNK